MKTDCNKCGGEGQIFTVRHVKNGVCFSCNGTGQRHIMKKSKVFKTVYKVSCEDVVYPYLKTLSEAVGFASEVQAMHLDTVLIEQHETYTIKFTRVKSA